MLDFKISIIWGATLERIRSLLEETDSMYLGLFISSLRYEKEEDGKKEKKKYLDSLKIQVKKINKEVATFNQIRRFSYGDKSELEKLPLVNFAHMREIVLKHKGDYPSNTGRGIIDEIMGTSDSASSLSRKYTALQLRNVLMPLRISLGSFVKSMDKLDEPFREFTEDKKKCRPIIIKELEKAMNCYSFNLKGESLFIIGRTIENLCDELLIYLKKKGNQDLKEIDVSKIDFDTKLNILHHKLKFFTPSMFSKAMGLKWDRNTVGHEIKSIKGLEKQAAAYISVGVNIILFLESEINGAKTKSKKSNP
jgi:hypothetical protein